MVVLNERSVERGGYEGGFDPFGGKEVGHVNHGDDVAMS